MSGPILDARAWRRIAESKIEQAILEGAFDALPGLGQPLDLTLDAHDENWWIKRKAKLEGLSLLPPALQLRRDVERELQRISLLPSEAEVRQACAALHNQIRAANRRIYWGPPSQTMPIDVEAVVSQWHDAGRIPSTGANQS